MHGASMKCKIYVLPIAVRCKIACLERKSRQLWQSIHRGWEWIRNDLRCRIRQKWLLVYVTCDEEHVLATGRSSKPSASSAATSKRPRISGICESNTYKACHTSEESEAHVRAICNEAEEVKENLKASETLRRALRKLTTLNWVLCYERYMYCGGQQILLWMLESAYLIPRYDILQFKYSIHTPTTVV